MYINLVDFTFAKNYNYFCDLSNNKIQKGEPYVKLFNGEMKIKYSNIDDLIDHIRKEKTGIVSDYSKDDDVVKCNICENLKNKISIKITPEKKHKNFKLCESCKDNVVKHLN
jgi:hypothetical protein